MSLLSTFIQAETHDYILQNGSYQISNILLTEAYTRIVTPLGSYQFDPTFGCELPTYFNTRAKLTSEFVTNTVNNALQPMISDNRAISVETVVTAITNNAVFFYVDITDNESNTYNLPLNFVGTI